ncbi:MAG: DUF192 domain-containing protein [Verrucomicrobia bacterium]|nr:DUF192 domain-containing protein [Verrucomicrobiota bacterium]MBI3869367.1 DUF192 domain-containing protein [Verrucomicrobiota bacterium]
MGLLKLAPLSVSASLLLTSIGCSETPAPPARAASPPPAVVATDERYAHPLDHAQPKLPTVQLQVGSVTLESEICAKTVEIRTGMMFRETMADTEGMLFLLPGPPQRAAFYMRNTKVPLSCAYIDKAGRILEIHDLRPYDETPVESATESISYVLEVPQGWFQRRKIAIGEFVRTAKGSLAESFPNRR